MKRAICVSAVLIVLLATATCGTNVTTQPNDQGSESASELRRCNPFESIDFGRRTASELQGRVMLEHDGQTVMLENVQIAAQRLSDDFLRHMLTGKDGRFAFDSLPPGEYEVWTCSEGFDEIRFRVSLDSFSLVRGFDLFLGPSEHPGRRDLIEIVAAGAKTKEGP